MERTCTRVSLVDLSSAPFISTISGTYHPAIASLKTLRKLFNRRSHVSDDRGPGGPPPVLNASRDGNDTPPAEADLTVVTHDGKTYTEDQLRHLVNEVKDYQLTHGSLMKIVQYETESSVPARPIGASLLPTVFPKRCFDEAVELQQAYNELYIRVASDPEWLFAVLKPLIEHDSFIEALWNVYVKVRDADALQDVVCAVFRSDYMLHQTPNNPLPELKQVEINTFSCAGPCHAERIAKLHQHLGRTRGLTHDQLQRFPQSNNTQSIVQLLKAAHDSYISTADGSKQKCVLMTVQPFNFNIADERPIVYGMWESHIPCYRVEWQIVLDRTTLTEDRTLLFRPVMGDSELEVSVIYYRGGYDAAEYRERSKDTRLRLEMARAIKSPDILTHLTTFKEVQRALTIPGAVERFVSEEKAARIKKTFMPMQTLDSSPENMNARKTALDPKLAVDYVLKPNRDGGGHNIYRSDIPGFLSQKPEQHWHKYVLMRLIEPPSTEGTLMTPEALYHGQVVSELGILGACLWKRTRGGSPGGVEILKNEVAGWTFKTKPEDIDEMSVVKGYGCFDCPLLVE